MKRITFEVEVESLGMDELGKLAQQMERTLGNRKVSVTVEDVVKSAAVSAECEHLGNRPGARVCRFCGVSL